MSLDAVGLVSSNLKETIKFYQILGIELKEVGGEDHLEGVTPSGVRIMADSVKLVKQLHPDWQKPTGSNIVLCFKQNDPKSVDQIFEQLKVKGYQVIKEPWNAFWGQRYCSILDPDQNQIDLFANL